MDEKNNSSILEAAIKKLEPARGKGTEAMLELFDTLSPEERAAVVKSNERFARRMQSNVPTDSEFLPE